jgi:hypothetical protein
MKTPTIHNYLETLSNPSGRFKTLSGIEIVHTPDGQPLYTVHVKSLDAAVRCQGREMILCLPLSGVEAADLKDDVFKRYLREAKGAGTRALLLLLREVLVFNDRDESDRYDALLVEAPLSLLSRRPTASPQPEEPTGERYEVESSFQEGLAVVRSGDRYGYVDREGCEVIPLRYDWADALEEGLAVIKIDDRFGLIDKKGNTVLEPIFEDMRWHADNGVVLACDQEGGWRLYSRQGQPVSEERFDFIFDFSGDLASVRRGDKYGYIDRSGTVIIPFLYEEAYSFNEDGLATVVKNRRMFTIDTEGMVFD